MCPSVCALLKYIFYQIFSLSIFIKYFHKGHTSVVKRKTVFFSILIFLSFHCEFGTILCEYKHPNAYIFHASLWTCKDLLKSVHYKRHSIVFCSGKSQFQTEVNGMWQCCIVQPRDLTSRYYRDAFHNFISHRDTFHNFISDWKV